MKLDLGKYETLPTNKIPKFDERIMKAMPSLFEHRCSEGVEGGLCQRMKEGTWLGHVIEHVALEMQVLAGMDCGYGRTRSTGEYGVYKVVFSYLSENAGVLAARAAVEFVQAIAEKKPYDLKAVIDELQEIWSNEAPGPSTQAILDEARKRNIPITRLDEDSLYMLGYGNKQQLFRATVMGTTNNLAVESAGCKWLTKSLLDKAGIAVPKGMVAGNREELDEALDTIPFPLVIKPIDGNHGRGITGNIMNRKTALKAAKQAWKISGKIIVEEYMEGSDYRFLLINYKLIAVAKRKPASVVGNGASTIRELIREVNNDPNRGNGHEKILTKIKIDYQTKSLLKQEGLDLDDVLPFGKVVNLKRTANLSTGGTSRDVTDLVHPYNVFMAERVARMFQLDVCGIDIMAKDIALPLKDGNGAVIEVNAGPGFRMHTHPSKGKARNVAEPVLEMLFPEHSDGRIPVVAITGTNGKTTTTRLIAHLATQAGKNVGFTTTEGVYINGYQIQEGDCSGPRSGRTVLSDPTIDYAVLECARGGILRSGLPFDKCEIGIVTNISEDHLGLDDIHTLDEYARVKEVVARSVVETGYAILNADDDRVYEMHRELDCKVILFSLNNQSERIHEHCRQGRIAVVVEDDCFVLKNGVISTRIIAVKDVPVTFDGTAKFMVANVLPAIAAGIVSGFGVENIQLGLQSFLPSPELTPGRMNLFDFGHCSLMLDYAHNASGFDAIQNYMDNVKATTKIGIIGATGDRKDEDIRNLGKYAATTFDEIIIRHDKDSRGRANDELTELLLDGIRSVNPKTPIRVISDEAAAMESAITGASQGAFIFACADHVKHSIELVRKLQDKLVYPMSNVS
jgi:cyanophycin synthetase